MKSTLKKLKFGNKVKKRIALEVIKMEIKTALGRKKCELENWASFFGGFGREDWKK